MRLYSNSRARSSSWAFSLNELLVSIAVIGIIAAISLPTVGDVLGDTDEAKTKLNAKSITNLSFALASAGVAHVLPESMGGVEATARLLRVGVRVPEGPLSGQFFQLSGLTDEEIKAASAHLEVIYDLDELRLRYRETP